MHVCVYNCVCLHVCMCVYIYVCVYIYIYIYIMYVCMYISCINHDYTFVLTADKKKPHFNVFFVEVFCVFMVTFQM